MARGYLIASVLILGSLVPVSIGQKPDSKTTALLDLELKSTTGIIDLTAKRFEEYVSGKSRPYTIVVIADSKNMRSQSKLQLSSVLKEYSMAARSFAKENTGGASEGKVFFTRVEFTTSKDLFGRLGITALPYLARIPPSMSVTPGGAVRLKKDDRIADTVPYPWTAEIIAEFVSEKTGLAHAEIKRTSFLHSRLMPFVTLAFVAGASLVGYQLYYLPAMRNPLLYILGALAIWWFSVSGGMFNIIRGMPLIGIDPRTRRAMLFTSGNGQLGAEGFIMGSLYTSFGLAVAAFTVMLPRLKEKSAQRVMGYGLLLVLAYVYRSVAATHGWKTGMQPRWYF